MLVSGIVEAGVIAVLNKDYADVVDMGAFLTTYAMSSPQITLCLLLIHTWRIVAAIVSGVRRQQNLYHYAKRLAIYHRWT